MNAPQVDVSYHDLNSLNELRAMASKDKVGAIRQAAKQFESVFMGMLLQSMRKASAPFEEDNPLNSQATGFYRDMYDSQLSTELSKNGALGLAELMVRQLAPETAKDSTKTTATPHQFSVHAEKNYALHDEHKHAMPLPKQSKLQLDPERVVWPTRSGDAVKSDVALVNEVAVRTTELSLTAPSVLPSNRAQQLGAEVAWQSPAPFNSASSIVQKVKAAPLAEQQALIPASMAEQRASLQSAQVSPVDELPVLRGPEGQFIKQVLPAARLAAKQLGIEPLALVAQAALETGWGQKLFKAANGQSSYNLFGVKAGSNWQGDIAVVDTLEYRQGLAQKEKAKFRVYQDFTQSLQDYVDVVKNQPRYQDALAVSHDTAQYFRQLQAAGYATDPNYAEKILQIFNGGLLKEVRNLLGKSDAGLADRTM